MIFLCSSIIMFLMIAFFSSTPYYCYNAIILKGKLNGHFNVQQHGLVSFIDIRYVSGQRTTYLHKTVGGV